MEVDEALAAIRDDFLRIGGHVLDVVPAHFGQDVIARLQFTEGQPVDAHPSLTGPVVFTHRALSPGARLQVLRVLWAITAERDLDGLVTPQVDPLRWHTEEVENDGRRARYRVLHLRPDDFTIEEGPLA